jgi:phage terminase large subunit
MGQIAITTALKKIKQTLYEPTFYKVIRGGMSSSKTFSIMILLISYAESYPNSLVTVAGMSYNHLATGAMRDFKKIMQGTNRWDDNSFNKTAKIYTFLNGSQIEFLSCDNMTSRGPRRDVLFVNEANGLNYETFDQLAGRTRDFVIIDYNPSAKFWAHEELVEKQKDRTSFIVLTYLDNEALSSQERENIESRKPKPGEEPSNWWSVYGLGQIGVLEGNIYSAWVESSEDDIKNKGKLVRYGLDFGFGHPTGMTAIYENEDGSLGIIEEIYERGILSSQYVDLLKRHNIDPNVLIVADSARPEIISDIKQAGYRIVPANKDAGSVMRGISRVQERQIYFYGKNLKREYLSYAWRKKRSTGETIFEPEKSEDDLCDSLRYAIDDLKKHRIEF